MHTHTLQFHSIRSGAARWFSAGLLACGLALALQAPALAAGCTPTHSIELWAKPGTLTLPDSTQVNIWGYAAASGDPAQIPGPTLTAAEGECVQVTLHNQLPGETTSLALHGQGLAADTSGAASSLDAVYTFSADRPGTFLYEAGLTTNGARQVAMGLYGALIVQPLITPTTYNAEAVLVLSEIDPNLNANPTGFDLGEYHPHYFLINGQAYPNIPDRTLNSGETTRLRYVNAGLNENSIGLLGLDQQVFAADSYALPNPYRVVAETIPPGGTLDALVAAPANAAQGTRYALYSASQHLDNNGAAYGGQLMYLAAGAPPVINVGAPPPAAPNEAPSVSLTDPASGAVLSGQAALTASASAAAPSTVTHVEFFADGLSLGVDVDGSDGWTAAWDTTLVVNGAHVLTAVATDDAAQSAASGDVNVDVNNAPPPGGRAARTVRF